MHNKTVSLEEARNQGLKHYFTGTPCKRGHISVRLVSSRRCCECSKIVDEKSRPRRMAYFYKWQSENRDKVIGAFRKYNEAHREERRELDRKRRSTKEGKAKKAMHERARRARERAGHGSVKSLNIEQMLISQKNRCAACCKKLKEFHIDHYVPIKLGGGSQPENLQALCPSCNLNKGAKCPIAWAQENGRLF